MGIVMENLEAFLQELAELSSKYNIVIAGCGCCGSPWLTDTARSSGTYEQTSIAGKRIKYIVDGGFENLYAEIHNDE